MSTSANQKGIAKFDVEVVQGPHKGLKLSFAQESVSIGRGAENDIILSNDSRVSRQHAEIKMHGNEYVIVNLSLKNFILVDGENVQSEILKQGSVIQIGNSEIRFIPEGIKKTQVPEMPQPMQDAFPVSLPGAGSGAQDSSTLPATKHSPFVDIKPQAPIAPRPQPMGPSAVNGGGWGGAETHDHGYGQRGPTPYSAGRPSSPASVADGSRARFYVIIGLVAIAGWFFFSSSKNKAARDPNAIRNTSESIRDVVAAEKRTQEMMSMKKEKYESVQYKRAQENFIKGFRDFQQGQYSRAREAFQVVLNLDPENELAKRYYQLSKIKFDELVKFNMIQGNRYREKRNWRMCQSNYSNVLAMLQNRKDDSTFKEAKQFFEECSLNVETGRF